MPLSSVVESLRENKCNILVTLAWLSWIKLPFSVIVSVFNHTKRQNIFSRCLPNKNRRKSEKKEKKRLPWKEAVDNEFFPRAKNWISTASIITKPWRTSYDKAVGGWEIAVVAYYEEENIRSEGHSYWSKALYLSLNAGSVSCDAVNHRDHTTNHTTMYG